MFLAHLVVVVLVVTGVLPRVVVPFWTLVLAVYVLWASLEDSMTFFIRSIPFFIAIPITSTFDSLNIWRVLSGLIFLKWTWHNRPNLTGYLKTPLAKILLAILLLAILSAISAPSHILAIKRILYFINLSLIGIVLYDLIVRNQDFSQRVIKNIAIPTIIVALIGIVQQISTYYLDIFQFVDFWGGIAERNLFGNAWAETAIKANTWFAYFGDQLSLRMFSIFPDSHSFPIFLLLGLPTILAIALRKVIEKGGTLKTMFKTRASVLVIFVPIIFLAAILSGTRGIWVASIGAVLVSLALICWHHKMNLDSSHRNIFKYISSYLVIFFLLFGLAYYIFASNQFQMSKNDSAIFGKRVRSVLDISETSNARRIEIWKASLQSIIKHPLLGVGIGNFPVVVGEDLAKAKAGSSAHNLYLNIAAELGIPALILALWFLWLLFKKIYTNFLKTRNSKLETVYYGSAIIYIPWVLIYSLTDVAIFDERAFLLFVITAALIFGQKENGQ